MFVRLYVGDQVGVAIDINNKNSLIGVSFRIRVFDIVEQTIIHHEEYRVRKRYASLGYELLILFRTPIKSFRHG